jgi:hypothetical protein
MRSFSVLLLSCAALILGLTGCGGGGRSAAGLKLVPVSGTVTLDDKPAPDVSVMFFPLGSAPGLTYYGNTDQNGRYQLVAGVGKTGSKGAPAGEYRVTCSKFVMPDGSLFRSNGNESPEMAGAKELLPPRYSSQMQTELKATVPAGGGPCNFDLKSK